MVIQNLNLYFANQAFSKVRVLFTAEAICLIHLLGELLQLLGVFVLPLRLGLGNAVWRPGVAVDDDAAMADC